MPRKLCAVMGCESIALAGKARCGPHQLEANEKLEASRASAKLSQAAQAGAALYRTQRWREASRKHLRRHPECIDCLELGVSQAASEVDHIIPHRGDKALFWDRSNWQSLCGPCHKRKTAREVFGSTTGGG